MTSPILPRVTFWTIIGTFFQHRKGKWKKRDAYLCYPSNGGSNDIRMKVL